MGAVSTAASSDMDRATSVPPAALNLGATISQPAAPFSSTRSSPATPRANGNTSKTKGMQLGATKTPISSQISVDWAEEAAAEAEAEETGGANPWGTDDLMDVNADQDDWSASTSDIHRYTYIILTIEKVHLRAHPRQCRSCRHLHQKVLNRILSQVHAPY